MALSVPVRLAAQISPGPLSRAHQSLDEPTHCGQCHGRSRGAMQRLCLECHREIAALIGQHQGYHGRLATGPNGAQRCATCHPEHAGRNFALIAWPDSTPERFDHRTAGWALDGRHAALACARCHQQAFRTAPAAALSPRRGSAGWVGLDTGCASCHTRDDPHRGALGTRCAACHTTGDWAPASRFDHDRSRYPLTGAHRQVSCAQCHLRAGVPPDTASNGRLVPRFRPLRFAECSACHADPHHGALSSRCSTCHVTAGFDVIDHRTFDHAATAFPLLGKHRNVACEACHGANLARPRPSFAACADCHRDVHRGEAVVQGAAVDCRSCHTVDGFVPATFSRADHAATSFALTGAHRDVACAACHVRQRAGSDTAAFVPLRIAVSGCVTCHADPHGGQVASLACATCHTDAAWTAVAFDSAAHARSGFPLIGRHGAVACTACHGIRRAGLPAPTATGVVGPAGVQFRIGETRCADCHADPHGAAAGSIATTDCAGCHSPAGFFPATVPAEAHARFGFVLDGVHGATACRDCHTAWSARRADDTAGATLIAAAAPIGNVPLAVVRARRCAGCHADPHGGQFRSRADSGRCDRCHATDTFIGAARFDHDHDADAAFPLAGAHARVACAACHRRGTGADATRPVVYRPLSRRCEDCHGRSGSGR